MNTLTGFTYVCIRAVISDVVLLGFFVSSIGGGWWCGVCVLFCSWLVRVVGML